MLFDEAKVHCFNKQPRDPSLMWHKQAAMRQSRRDDPGVRLRSKICGVPAFGPCHTSDDAARTKVTSRDKLLVSPVVKPRPLFPRTPRFGHHVLIARCICLLSGPARKPRFLQPVQYVLMKRRGGQTKVNTLS